MLRLRPHHVEMLHLHPKPRSANYRHLVNLYGADDALYTIALSTVLREHPQTLVEIVTGADDICDACSLRSLCDTDHDELLRRELEVVKRIYGADNEYEIVYSTPHDFDRSVVGMLGPSIAERWRLAVEGRHEGPIVETYGNLVERYIAAVKEAKRRKKS